MASTAMTSASGKSFSTNPKTGVAYPLPDSATDRAAIDRFLAANRGKKIIVVQGLGFVGAVMALVCANSPGREYAVLGVDLPTAEAWWRIQSLNDGVFPLSASDPKIGEFFATARSAGNFYATFDPYAYSVADVIVVDINLDVKKTTDSEGVLNGFSVDLTAFRKAIETIGEQCRPDVLVVIETTVPPGTCQRVVWPILERCLANRGLPTAALRLGHSYERVTPGPNYVDSIREFPRVYAGIDDSSAAATEAFLRTIIDVDKCPLSKLSNTTASEIAKVLENSYRALNIAFIVEWSRFAEEAGVDLYAVVDAIRRRPTHSNLMYPNIGVGGYCLTKDPLLASWARTALLDGAGPLECTEGAVRTNDQMPTYAFRLLQEWGGAVRGKKLLLMGVAYRGDVGDTRFSPVDAFHDHLVASGATVAAHDPFVPHWPEKDVHTADSLGAALLDKPDIVVISAGHSEYREEATTMALLKAEPCLIFDAIGLLSADQIATLKTRHRVKVLGRGDL